MDTLSCVDALCALDSPYHEDSDSQRLFDEAMREIVAFHVMNTPGYRQWLARHNIPADAANIDSWSQLPPIFADYFKQNLPIGRSGEDALELTSSGTSGQKSRMRYDARSIGAAQGMVDRIFRHYGWETPDAPCNYLLLSYEPADIITLGTSFTDQFLCKYAPVKRAVYALRHTGSCLLYTSPSPRDTR